MEKILLKPSELVEILGLGRTKVYALIASGAIPSIRIGGSRRVTVNALRTWVEQQSQVEASMTT